MVKPTTSNKLKVIFAGTPEFALPALHALWQSEEHELCAIYTRPDKPAGRGLKLVPSPVKKFAVDHQIPLYQLSSFNNPEDIQTIHLIDPDVLINVACGIVIPQALLDLPRYGCINIHPSILPRWRGAAPIQRAILAGDTVTGVTIMQMDAGLDTGAILKQLYIPIEKDTTAADLLITTADAGAIALMEVLYALSHETLIATPQSNANSTYAAKITKTEANLDWELPATQLNLMIRAFNPWPVAYTSINQIRLRIWSSVLVDTNTTSAAGTIIQCNHSGLDIATGSGVLRLTKIQLPGTKILTAADVVHGYKNLFIAGNILEPLAS